ncbi:MAG TPA: hypothetical protein PKV27_10890 [Ilumatobacteraceae bacterium]|nr:hypothetical protein [Ilumatobacteraceae bacterium]
MVRMGAKWTPGGRTTGIGSLPHRSTKAAAAFAFAATSIPAIPTLPRRSPAEAMICQALVGVHGFDVGPYGSLAVNLSAVDPQAGIKSDLTDEAFRGTLAFLQLAQRSGYRGDVKWHFVGPVTLGIALARAGVPARQAFDVAVNAVRSHMDLLLDAVDLFIADARQIVFLDEPSFFEVAEENFFLPPDAAADLISTALARIEPRAIAGVHCCADVNINQLLDTGPQVLSVPVTDGLLEYSARLIRFLEDDGVIAWGAVPTSGPLPVTAERPWRVLSELWCELVRRGADPLRLRHQALITPACGLAAHSVSVAERLFTIASEVGTRVSDQSAAAHIAYGA